MRSFEANSRSNIKRLRGAKNDEIREIDSTVLRTARSKNIPITGPMLQEKAMQIAKALDVQPEEFKASNGRLNRFKTRNGIKAKFISGD